VDEAFISPAVDGRQEVVDGSRAERWAATLTAVQVDDSRPAPDAADVLDDSAAALAAREAVVEEEGEEEGRRGLTRAPLGRQPWQQGMEQTLFQTPRQRAPRGAKVEAAAEAEMQGGPWTRTRCVASAVEVQEDAPPWDMTTAGNVHRSTLQTVEQVMPAQMCDPGKPENVKPLIQTLLQHMEVAGYCTDHPFHRFWACVGMDGRYAPVRDPPDSHAPPPVFLNCARVGWVCSPVLRALKDVEMDVHLSDRCAIYSALGHEYWQLQVAFMTLLMPFVAHALIPCHAGTANPNYVRMIAENKSKHKTEQFLLVRARPAGAGGCFPPGLFF
jgi:hypothetical protein